MITAKLCVITGRWPIEVSVDDEDLLMVKQDSDMILVDLDYAHELIAALTEVVERHKAATRITKGTAK